MWPYGQSDREGGGEREGGRKRHREKGERERENMRKEGIIQNIALLFNVIRGYIFLFSVLGVESEPCTC